MLMYYNVCYEYWDSILQRHDITVWNSTEVMLSVIGLYVSQLRDWTNPWSAQRTETDVFPLICLYPLTLCSGKELYSVPPHYSYIITNITDVQFLKLIIRPLDVRVLIKRSFINHFSIICLLKYIALHTSLHTVQWLSQSYKYLRALLQIKLRIQRIRVELRREIAAHFNELFRYTPEKVLRGWRQ
jgi:hypothetical protein